MLLLPGQAELFSLVLSPPQGCAGVGGGGQVPGTPGSWWVTRCSRVGVRAVQAGGSHIMAGQGKELLPCALSLILSFPSQLVP